MISVRTKTVPLTDDWMPERRESSEPIRGGLGPGWQRLHPLLFHSPIPQEDGFQYFPSGRGCHHKLASRSRGSCSPAIWVEC